MTKNTVIPFEDRVEKAAKILNINPNQLTEALKKSGVDCLEILDSSSVSVEDLVCAISPPLGLSFEIPFIKAKVAAGILKIDVPKDGSDTSKDGSDTSKVGSDTSLADLIKSQRPVSQWSDEEVLTKYIETDDEQYESELQRRSKNRRFIVLKEGNKEVDVEASLLMLKRARKEEIPSFFIGEDKKVIHIYKVEAYHIDNRVRYESPLRPGVMLFDGFCKVSNQNFKNVGDPARKFLRLIHLFGGTQSRMEEAKLVKIAEKEGVDGLGKIFPEILVQYMELSAIDGLPSLKTIAPVETRQADPFYQKTGNRTY